ncbi:MAG TPA: sodium:proton antiporter [Vulgatibacter sp.]|nr:sodium:proton antiporter [Vulgatibacter sp.]
MNLALALCVAVVFGAGIRLMLDPDLVRIAAGTILVSNAANLFIMSAGTGAQAAGQAQATTSDPLVQALVLTSLVITFGFTALLFSILHAIYRAWGTLDSHEIDRPE